MQFSEIVSQVTFVMVALPIAGALFILCTAGWGIGHIRRMALTNVVSTAALAVVMVAAYDPELKDAEGRPELIQLTTVMPWAGGHFDPTAASLDAFLKSANQRFVSFDDVQRLVSEGIVRGEHDESAEQIVARLDLNGDRELSIAEVGTVGPDIRFALGVDGISLWLIALSALLMIPSVLVSWEAITDRPAAYYALMLLLEAGMIGVFAAQDIMLFYVFFEFTLIPLFFMIGMWGGHDRRWAARKFFIYTLAGSVLTFLGLIAIVLSYSWMSEQSELTFSIPHLTQGISQLLMENTEAQVYWRNVSPWIFLALFAGFAIKVPLVPFHTWLPLAHVEAPTAGSVLLAGILLKVGSYGFLRFALPLVPEACFIAFHWIAVLSVIGIIYGAFLALAQSDIKKLVAYSSVSHMGYCLLGLFALNGVGITGGMMQMINHGLSTGALFTMVGMIYERYHTRDIESYRGLAKKFPVMAFFLVVIAFSSIGLPGLNGFTSEILSLIGMFRSHPLYAVLSLSGIILGAWYMLWLVQRTFFGPLREPIPEGHSAVGGHAGHVPPADLNGRELCALVPLVALIVWIGIDPQFFIRRMEPSINQVMEHLVAGYQRVPLDARPFSPSAFAASGGASSAAATIVDPLVSSKE